MNQIISSPEIVDCDCQLDRYVRTGIGRDCLREDLEKRYLKDLNQNCSITFPSLCQEVHSCSLAVGCGKH